MISITEIPHQYDLFAHASPSEQKQFEVKNSIDENIIQAEMLPEELSRWKFSVRRQELLRILKGIIAHREYALSSFHLESSSSQQKWEAIITLKEKIEFANSFKKHIVFYNYLSKHSLYLLEFIAPAEMSKLSPNFNTKLRKIKEEIASAQKALLQHVAT